MQVAASSIYKLEDSMSFEEGALLSRYLLHTARLKSWTHKESRLVI
ncbi:MAG: hypothetical protein ACLTJG_09450 [[Clostridium] innocuum]